MDWIGLGNAFCVWKALQHYSNKYTSSRFVSFSAPRSRFVCLAEATSLHFSNLRSSTSLGVTGKVPRSRIPFAPFIGPPLPSKGRRRRRRRRRDGMQPKCTADDDGRRKGGIRKVPPPKVPPVKEEERPHHSWARSPRILRARWGLLHFVCTFLQWDRGWGGGGGS